MAYNQKDLAFIEEQLKGFGDFYSKKMFGGVGFFREGLMFGMIGGGAFRLKADQVNQADFEAKGMEPLYHRKDHSKKPMPYWEVPVEVLEDKEALIHWANKAYEAALRNKKK